MGRLLALDSINDHEIIQHITAHMPPAETLVSVSINKVIVDQDALQIDINPLKMRQVLQAHLNFVISEKSALPNLTISVPFTI